MIKIAFLLMVLIQDPLPYAIVDTGQVKCYDNRKEIDFPKTKSPFFGQDAQYGGNQPSYKLLDNGVVLDLNTSLMWVQDPGEKMTYAQAVKEASKCEKGGYKDWRLPTIKELYSLMLFSGIDPDPRAKKASKHQPFIDSKVFKFKYGQPQDGDRIIDSQYATCTLYKGKTMGGNQTMFGVNFADGRIKGYPIKGRGGRKEKKYYALYVRGNKAYGKNDFKDNKDGTVTDKATGLIWMKADSGVLKAGKNKDGKMNWEQSLKWAENLTYAGRSDWRLPNAKELHSIVDYSRSPGAAAIDPVFQTSSFVGEGGEKAYPYYWTSTTHAGARRAGSAVYMAFGKALGWMRNRLLDVHGAGAQRSDPKSGDVARFPRGRGPQGDVIRIYNYARCVCSGPAK